MTGPVLVTTSWDDGHVLDARLAELLTARGIEGTFYIAPENIEFSASQLLSPSGLRELADRFEIGGHTLRHHRLTTLTLAQAEAEIRDGKARVEELIGQPVTSFCYPGGQYRPEHAALARQAGFRCARTVRRLSTAPVTEPFEMRTTVQARPHVRDWPKVALINGFRPVRSVRCTDWSTLAIALFDRVLATGGVFHLWGHSWEIDQFGHWDRLTRVLDHIAHREGVRYTSNAGLVVRP